jgi:uncharacterized iron-regulated protein
LTFTLILLLTRPLLADDFEAAISAIPDGTDVIILGEVHDSPIHHANQARALSKIRPRAVIFEMLTPEQADDATPDVRTSAESLAEALDWKSSGWPDFDLYWPVFEALGETPIVGAALPRELVRRAVEEDLAEILGEDATRFGLDIPLPDAEQSEREAEQFANHCDALPKEMLPGMVAAQRLRDAAFARTTLEALEVFGAPVVLITGNGHARYDRGVPVYLAEAMPQVTVHSVGQLEGNTGNRQPFSNVIVTSPTEREDPCAAFQG